VHALVDGMGRQHDLRQEEKPIGEILAYLIQGRDQALVQHKDRVGALLEKVLYDFDSLSVIAVVHGLMQEIECLHVPASLRNLIRVMK
jgi:hypothetical protein